jgi:hypothetical protein
MDSTEIRFIERPLLRRESRKFLEKSACPLSCESPLKIPRHLVQLLEIRKRIASAGMKFIAL